MLDWKWFDDDKTFKLLMYLILTVNFKDKEWKGITIKAGQKVISIRNLSETLGWSNRTLRTHLSRLIESGELTKKTTNKYTLVTLVKWEQMQIDKNEATNELPHKVHTTKERKESKESKEEYIYPSFDDFWNLYDKKIDVKKCKSKWQKLPHAIKKNIMDYIPKYKLSNKDKQYRKNPATFLNNESWNNDIEVKKERIRLVPLPNPYEHPIEHKKASDKNRIINQQNKLNGYV